MDRLTHEDLEALLVLYSAPPATKKSHAIYAGDVALDLRDARIERDQLRAENERLRDSEEKAQGEATNLATRMATERARAEAAEQERDEARQAAVDLAKKVGIEKVLAAETVRADEAQALLHDLAIILNPHEAYDATKLTGWARDTAERAREADVAQAHAADLRGALDDVLDSAKSYRSDILGLHRDSKPTDAYFQFNHAPKRGDRDKVIAEAEAALARTPAQSLGRLKGEALREFAKSRDMEVIVTDEYSQGIQDERITTVRDLRETADRLEKEATDGR